jgi:hypothetical protein
VRRDGEARDSSYAPVQKYIDMRTESQADRLMLELKWEADPGQFAKLVTAAISRFEDLHRAGCRFAENGVEFANFSGILKPCDYR